MAALTIRNVDDDLKTDLRVRAAHHGRSMESEARTILRNSFDLADRRPEDRTLAEVMHELFGSIGGVDLPDREQEPVRDPPTFD